MSESSVKCPIFKGEKKDFQGFWIRFMAYARVKKFISGLNASTDMPANETDGNAIAANTTDATEIRQMKAMEDNYLAMAHLTTAMGTDALLNKLAQACTTEWPGGLVHEVATLLKAEYQPVDCIARVEMRGTMNKIEMTKFEDPARLFERIASLVTQFQGLNTTIQEEELIALAMNQDPREYSGIIAAIEVAKETALMLRDIGNAMEKQFCIMYGDSKVTGKGKELTLSAFEGICYNCGAKGHRAIECTKEKSSRQVDYEKRGKKKSEYFRGKCNDC